MYEFSLHGLYYMYTLGTNIILSFIFMYVYMYICICMYVCMYVYFNKWRSDRVLVRLGLNTLIGWLHAVR